jgi:hypothetical protein
MGTTVGFETLLLCGSGVAELILIDRFGKNRE